MNQAAQHLIASINVLALRLARVFNDGVGEPIGVLQAALRVLIAPLRAWLMARALAEPLPVVSAPVKSAPPRAPDAAIKPRSPGGVPLPPPFGFSLLAPQASAPRQANKKPRAAQRAQRAPDAAAAILVLRLNAIQHVLANPAPAIAALRQKLAREAAAGAPAIGRPTDHPSADKPKSTTVSAPLNRAQRRKAKARARQAARAGRRPRRDSG